MTEQERGFMDLAFKYKEQYKSTAWWKFKKRYKLKRLWDSALDCMVRYGK